MNFNKIYYKGKEMKRDTNAESGVMYVKPVRNHWWQIWRSKQTYVDFKTIGEAMAEQQSVPKGHVVKAKPAEYNPDTTRRGGRVVKAMPRELRKVKEAQELIPDDEPVQQLPD